MIFTDIPFWKQYALSVEEAAQYFRIGEKKLRRIANDNPEAEYILWSGNRALFKREMFSKFLDKQKAI